MDNDRQLRSEFRRALDDMLPPAPWLEADVRARLQELPRNRGGSVRRPEIVLRWTRVDQRLAAVLLVVVIAAAAIGVFLVAHGALRPSVPVGVGARGTITFGRINANGDEYIFTIHADGSGEKQLLASASCCVAWSHKGNRLLLAGAGSAGTVTTAIVNSDGSGYRALPIGSTGLNLGPGRWSPDDSRIAFEGWDDANSSLNGIYTADSTDGGNRRRVTTTTQHDVPISYSPDGSMILFRRGSADASKPGELFVVGVDGGAVTRVSPSGMTVAIGFFGDPGGWSPDGTEISFAAFSPIPSDAGRSAVFVAAGNGTNPRQISAWGDNTTSARFSPSGDWIVFDRAVTYAGPNHTFFLVRPDGSGTTAIPSIYGACCAVWSPDGSRLAFIEGPDNQVELWTAELDGSHLTRLTKGPANLTDVGWGGAAK